MNAFWLGGIGVALAAGCVGMVVVVVGSRDLGKSVVVVLLGGAFGFFGYLMLGAALDAWRRRHEQIHLHERGLVFELSSTRVERPWSDFVGAQITSVRRYGVEANRLLDMAFKDGTERRLTGLSEQNALFDVVRSSVPPLGFDAASIRPRSGSADSDPAVAALGKRLSSHGHEGTRTLMIFALVGLALGGLFGVGSVSLALSPQRGSSVGSVVLGLLAVWGIHHYVGRLLGHRRRQHEIIHAHEHGLVFERAGRVDVLKWTDIRSVSRYNAELTLKLNSGKSELLVGVQAHTALFGVIETRVARP